MTRKSFLGYVVLPVLALFGYFECLLYFPHFTKKYVHREDGVIELGTAVAFLIAGSVAARLAWKTRSFVPTRYHIFYCLFAAAGLLVSLEEISYGQKFFEWSSPSWFMAHNKKGETNLHNAFGNKPTDVLRSVATIGCPVLCAILPAWIRVRKSGWPAGSWKYYLLPGTELATIAGLTIVLTVFNKIPSIKRLTTWSGHLGEIKELYWGIAAACYVAILWRRLGSARSLADQESRRIGDPPVRRAA
jgi:hypothetical protein